MSKNFYLHKTAQEGFKAYIRAYASHKQKAIFDVAKLDITKSAKSFGFAVAPHVDLRILFTINDVARIILDTLIVTIFTDIGSFNYLIICFYCLKYGRYVVCLKKRLFCVYVL